MENLTATEEVVMKIVWDSDEPVSWSDIQIKAEKMGHIWARQTISTFLLHLREKGFLAMERKGRETRYTPLVNMKEYRSAVMRDLVDVFFHGDLTSFAEYAMRLQNAGNITENPLPEPSPGKLADSKEYLIKVFADKISALDTDGFCKLLDLIEIDLPESLIDISDAPEYLLSCENCQRIYGRCEDPDTIDGELQYPESCHARFRRFYGN